MADLTLIPLIERRKQKLILSFIDPTEPFLTLTLGTSSVSSYTLLTPLAHPLQRPEKRGEKRDKIAEKL